MKKFFRDNPNFEKVLKKAVDGVNDFIGEYKTATVYIDEHGIVIIKCHPLESVMTRITPSDVGRATFTPRQVRYFANAFMSSQYDGVHWSGNANIVGYSYYYSLYFHPRSDYADISAQRNVACLCCGYRTISTASQFEICPVCFWEDDPYYHMEYSDDREPSEVNGDITLAKARHNYASYGASRRKYLRHVRDPHEYEV